MVKFYKLPTTSPVIQAKHQVVVTFPPPPFLPYSCESVWRFVTARNVSLRRAYLGVTPGYFLSLSSIHPCRDPSTFGGERVPACVKDRRTGCDRLVRRNRNYRQQTISYPVRPVVPQQCHRLSTLPQRTSASRACVDHGIDCNAHMPAGKRSRM